MNRKSLLLIALSCFLVACGAQVVGTPMPCEPYSGPDPACRNDNTQNKYKPRVKINSNSLRVTPACVRASRTAKIVVQITPVNRNELGSARIFPKGDRAWPAGTNDIDKDKILIEIPDDLPSGYYSYGFVVNGRCVDPRVHVED